VVALPGEHVLAQDRNAAIALKRLARETFILYGPPGSGMHDATMVACRVAGFSPRAGQEAPRITSTLSLVASGLGIALVPESLQQMRMDGVVYRRIKGSPQPKAILSLASRRGDPSAVVRQFLNLAKGAMKTFSAGDGKVRR